MSGATAATDPPLPPRPRGAITRPPGSPGAARATAVLPGHAVVAELGPGTVLVRSETTGALAVLRRTDVPRRALERRLALLARAPGAGPAVLVEPGGVLHVLRPFAPGRPLVELVAGRPDPATALRLARALARTVAALGRAGIVHGALHPGNVIVQPGGAIALTDAEVPLHALAPSRAPAVPFAAPEVLRGRPATPASDAFSVAAIVHALLAGASPFASDDVLDAVRRVLNDPPPPLTLLRPGLPPGISAAVQAALAKRPRGRAGVAALLDAIEAATGAPTELALESAAGRAEARTELATVAHGHDRSGRGRSRALLLALAVRSRLAALLPRSRPQRLLLASGALLAIALGAVLQRDVSIEGDVRALVARGEHAKARALLDRAEARRPGDPVVEKLRGDVACARGAAGECVRRYRVALAARPELRRDPALRENARTLLARAQSCGGRRAAAELLGEIRDPAALPALEQARRAAGPFAAFCTGDAIDRAISATRAAPDR